MKTTSSCSYKKIYSFLLLTLTLVLAFLCSLPVLAGTLLVDDDHAQCPDAGYNSIQRAVDAAAPGDVIQVCPGTYHEQVEIAKPLTLGGVKRDGKKRPW